LSRALYTGGIASYDSIERAAFVIERLLAWRARRKGLPQLF